MSAEATRAEPLAEEVGALEALRRGDVHASIAELMNLYGRPIFRYACHVVGDADLAQDVLQTTFLQAYSDLPRFGGRSSLRVWLYGIARHRCLDALKARRRRRWRFPSLPEGEEWSARVPTVPPIEPREDTLALALARCLQALPPAVRTAVMLRYQDEFSYGEMASVCDEAPATLQARVARALPVLRRCLEQQGVRP